MDTTKSEACVFELAIPTAVGDFRASYSEAGLCALNFPSDKRAVKESSVRPVPRLVRRWHEITSRAVTKLLSGNSPETLPPLDLSAGTDFQQRVWRALCGIRLGQTCSYGEIAEAIGKPTATRAVGAACGANPIPLLVPCHRVLAANHRIGGFSAGLKWKRLLLAKERTFTFA